MLELSKPSKYFLFTIIIIFILFLFFNKKKFNLLINNFDTIEKKEIDELGYWKSWKETKNPSHAYRYVGIKRMSSTNSFKILLAQDVPFLSALLVLRPIHRIGFSAIK